VIGTGNPQVFLAVPDLDPSITHTLGAGMGMATGNPWVYVIRVFKFCIISKVTVILTVFCTEAQQISI